MSSVVSRTITRSTSVVARPHALVRLARAHLGVEVECLPEPDVDRAEALADRCRDRALERDAVAADRLERLLGQRVAAVLGHHVGAGRAHVPLELDARRVEHAACRLGQLGTGAVAGDQGDAVSHGPRIVRSDGKRPAARLGGGRLDARSASVFAVNDFQPGLEGVIAFETEIAEPDREGSALRYRGVDIEELVGSYPFEQVWGLLVDGRFEPGMPPAERIELQDASGSVMADLQAGLATLGPKWGLRQLVDISPEAARDDLARLSAAALSIVAQSARGSAAARARVGGRRGRERRRPSS